MIRIRQIKIDVLKDNNDLLVDFILKKLKINRKQLIDYVIIKRSIDARDKSLIYYVYEVNVSVSNEAEVIKRVKSNDIFLSPSLDYQMVSSGNLKLNYRPIIVGSGPAGLFCAYILALKGYKPIVIERGECVEKRVETVEKFFKTGILNENSNVQFGEGGAGTFSDGKLNTLNKDENNRGRFVFETFVKHGAHPQILYSNKPHVGTDVLVNVIKNLREEIKSLGASIMYNSCLTDIIISDNKVSGIVVNNKDKISCDCLVLAIGHSARDTFKLLHDLNIDMKAKPFAVGVRVQHSQDFINLNQYGIKYAKVLPPADYKLTYTTKCGRGVYSFCMCPGGYVVNASSEDNSLAINGMSYSKRDSMNANSAIIVTVSPNDFGNNPLDGISFQRNLEEKAFKYGNGKIPVQLLKDYKNNVVSTGFLGLKPIFKGDYCFSNINDILPDFINDSIKEAFINFDKKIKNFSSDDTILAAVESRTSSPIKIIRNEFLESNIGGIYPCGEGCGYAGGITSASIDGVKVAEEIIKKYYYI